MSDLPSTPVWECPQRCGASYPSWSAAEACCQDDDDDLIGDVAYWRTTR